MKIKNTMEIVDVANEYMVIPTGDAATSLKGIVALNECSAFLLNNMKTEKTEEELVELLMSEYLVDKAKAEKDVQLFIEKLINMGVIER